MVNDAARRSDPGHRPGGMAPTAGEESAFTGAGFPAE